MSDRPITDNPAVNGCSELMLAVVLVIVACVCFCSCKPVKEVQVERVEVPVVVTQEHTIESVKIDHIRDTLIQRDSVYYFVKGDTVVIERWHHIQGNTVISKVDTLHVFDSVPVPVEVTKEKVVTKVEQVEKPLNWWQKLFISLGGITLILGALFIAWKFGKSKIK